MNLQNIRKKIDLIDRKILRDLSIRMRLSIKTTRYKKNIKDPKREKEIIKNIKRNCKGGLSPNFALKLYRLIIKESKRIQKTGGKK